jgi:hypothetical protein
MGYCRLKVHYRAAPDARGSGIERGHGEELPFCPLCNADLKKVRYHKCTALPTPVTVRFGAGWLECKVVAADARH